MLTHADVLEIGKKIIDFSTVIGDEGKAVNILADSSGVSSWGETVYALMVVVFKDIDFHKLATFGANKAISSLQRKTITNANIQDKARVCKTREEAEAWLAEN